MTQIELDFYMMTEKRVCTDCEGKELDKTGDRLDKLYEELSKVE